MKHLLLNRSWLACLLVAVELPVMFLYENIREGPSRRMPALMGKEALVDSIAGLASLTVVASLLFVLILAGWRDALFVTVAALAGYGANQWIEVAFLSWGLTDEVNYRLVAGPVLWTIAALIMAALRFCMF